jgi:hypothetical protein
MHRVNEESWLTKSAHRSIARRAQAVALVHDTQPPRRLDKMCLLIEVRCYQQPGSCAGPASSWENIEWSSLTRKGEMRF